VYNQRDQRSDTLDLLQQRHLWVTRLRTPFDPFVVLADPFAQLCDGRQQRLQRSLQSGLNPSAFSGFMLRTLQPRNLSQ
jgi:hypothetical protein